MKIVGIRKCRRWTQTQRQGASIMFYSESCESRARSSRTHIHPPTSSLSPRSAARASAGHRGGVWVTVVRGGQYTQTSFLRAHRRQYQCFPITRFRLMRANSRRRVLAVTTRYVSGGRSTQVYRPFGAFFFRCCIFHIGTSESEKCFAKNCLRKMHGKRT